VILGLGVRPYTALAAQAGIPLGPAGRIAVDRRLRTGVEGVWAAGDCAEKFHRVSRRPVTIALGTHANKEGRTAGINIGGGYATFRGVLGTAVTKICDVQVGRTGLGETDTRAAGFDPLTVAVDSTTRAGYYPGAKPIRTKLIVERGTGRLLGAQIVGGGRRRQAHRRARNGSVARDHRGRAAQHRPVLRAAVLPTEGPGADRRPQGLAAGRGRPTHPRPPHRRTRCGQRRAVR